MNTKFNKYAGVLLASTVVIGGIASAAITPIPVISNTFAVAGQVIKSADINKLAEALNILDARTNGTAPTDPNHLTDKEYVDGLKWSNVALTDTNDFNPSCEYRFSTSNGDGWGYLTAVGKDYLSVGFHQWFQPGSASSYQTAWIFKSDKSKVKTGLTTIYHNNNLPPRIDPEVITTVTNLQKRCQ